MSGFRLVLSRRADRGGAGHEGRQVRAEADHARTIVTIAVAAVVAALLVATGATVTIPSTFRTPFRTALGAARLTVAAGFFLPRGALFASGGRRGRRGLSRSGFGARSLVAIAVTTPATAAARLTVGAG